MYDFAKKIGGDKVEVINLVPAGTEPHDWEPSTKDLIEMEKSDIFIYNGAGMEQWVDDVLESLDKIRMHMNTITNTTVRMIPMSG